MTLVATFLACWLVMVATPRIPIGRLLCHCLVERPAAIVARVTRGHLALAALLGIAASLVAWVGEADGLRVATMAAPEIATWITTFEVATYLDVAIGMVAAWTGLRAGSLPLVASFVQRPFGRRRSRGPRTHVVRAADNDGDRLKRLPVAA